MKLNTSKIEKKKFNPFPIVARG